MLFDVFSGASRLQRDRLDRWCCGFAYNLLFSQYISMRFDVFLVAIRLQRDRLDRCWFRIQFVAFAIHRNALRLLQLPAASNATVSIVGAVGFAYNLLLL